MLILMFVLITGCLDVWYIVGYIDALRPLLVTLTSITSYCISPKSLSYLVPSSLINGKFISQSSCYKSVFINLSF